MAGVVLRVLGESEGDAVVLAVEVDAVLGLPLLEVAHLPLRVDLLQPATGLDLPLQRLVVSSQLLVLVRQNGVVSAQLHVLCF